MKQQRVKFAVETTPPECLFDHSTIFDYSFIFPAAVSLSVVLLSFELLYQHYIATINDICGPKKAMERWILSGSVIPRLDSIYSLYNYWMFVYFSVAVSLSVGSTYAWCSCGHTDENYCAWSGKLEESGRYLGRYVMADGTIWLNDTYGLGSIGMPHVFIGGGGAAYWSGVDGSDCCTSLFNGER